jgi:hypothetical protein
MVTSKKGKAPLTEDQQQTFAEAEKAAKAVQPAGQKGKREPKKVIELSNGAKRIDW